MFAGGIRVKSCGQQAKKAQISGRAGIRSDVVDSSRGFTLIELLVVIAIIGMLASIVLASLAGLRDSAKKVAAYAAARAINADLFSCMMSNTSNVEFCYGGSGHAGSWNQPAQGCGGGGGAYPVPGQNACGIGSTPDARSPLWPDVEKYGYFYSAYGFTYSNQRFEFEIYKTGNTTTYCCTPNGCSEVVEPASPPGQVCEAIANAL